MPSTELRPRGGAAIFVMVVCATVAYGRAGAAPEPRAQAHGRRLVAAVAAGLSPAYGLAVVPVPPPPGAAAGLCPLQVRAMVRADPCDADDEAGCHSDSGALGDVFAVVACKGLASRIVRVGDSFTLDGTTYAVRDMGTQHLTLQAGAATIRCALANLTR